MLSNANYRSRKCTLTYVIQLLQLEEKNGPPLFVTGKTYRDYYEEEEIDAVAGMFRKLALRNTWENVRHYF